MVKESFWFAEFRKVVGLLNAGKTLPEIRALNQAENIFAAPTQARSVQIYSTVTKRVQAIDSSFYPVFERSDIGTQKLIALIAVMQSDALFLDFMAEVFREKLIMGLSELTDSDMAVFFSDKQRQSERVATWEAYTLKRLGACYKTLLMEAGLLERGAGKGKILRPLLDAALEECLEANGMQTVWISLTGGR
jgi:hypothetical protein